MDSAAPAKSAQSAKTAANLAADDAARHGHAWALCRRAAWQTHAGAAWVASSRYCGVCNSLSSFFSRRSHCRVCGSSVCLSCAVDGDEAWLRAPYITLCAGIPEGTHARMRVCKACHAACCEREQTWLWSRVLVDLLPFGVHAKDWEACSRNERACSRDERACSRNERACSHKEPVRVRDASQLALAHCTSRLAARFRHLTAADDRSRATSERAGGERATSESGASDFERAASDFESAASDFEGAALVPTVLDRALVAADKATVHAFDVTHRTPKFVSLPDRDAAALLHKMCIRDVLSVLRQPQSVQTATWCSASQEQDGSCRAELVAALPVCAPSNRRALVASMSRQQKIAAACVHGRLAVDALATFDASAAADARQRVCALLDTLEIIRHARPQARPQGPQGPQARPQGPQARKAEAAPQARKAEAGSRKAEAGSQKAEAVKLPAADAAHIYAGGTERRLTEVHWLDPPQYSVAEIVCSPPSRLMLWLECVDPRLVAAAAFVSPAMYLSLFQSTITREDFGPRQEGREVPRQEGREVLRQEGREVPRQEGREVPRREGREGRDRTAPGKQASIVLTVPTTWAVAAAAKKPCSTFVPSPCDCQCVDESNASVSECNASVSESNASVSECNASVSECNASVSESSRVAYIRRVATPKSMFVQSLLLTVLQLATGKHIDRAKAKFLVDKEGNLLCYSAPLFNPEPNPEPSQEPNPEPNPEPALPRLLTPAQQENVRAACVRFLNTSTTYVWCLGMLLTGDETAPTRKALPVKPDCPLIYLV